MPGATISAHARSSHSTTVKSEVMAKEILQYDQPLFITVEFLEILMLF